LTLLPDIIGTVKLKNELKLPVKNGIVVPLLVKFAIVKFLNGVEVGVLVGVIVGVSEIVGVILGVNVLVGVTVGVAVIVGVLVGVSVFVAVMVGVAVFVGVKVGVAVLVGVGVGEGVGLGGSTYIKYSLSPTTIYSPFSVSIGFTKI
jgi:hypothetical protein